MRGLRELKLIGRLMTYAIRHHPSIVPISLCGIVSACAELAAVMSIIPLGMVAAGNQLSPQSLWYKIPALMNLAPNAKFFIILFLSVWLLRIFSSIAATVLNAYAFKNLFAHLTTQAHAAFVRHLAFAEIIKHQIGHFYTLAGDDANRGAQIVVGCMRLLPVVILFSAYIAFVFYQSWRAGLAVMALAAITAFALKGAFRLALKLGHRQQEEARATHTLFFDSLSGLRTVRGFTAENFVTSRYSALIEKYLWTNFVAEALTVTSQVPFAVLMALVLVGVLYADNSWLLLNMPVFFAGLMIFTRLTPIASYGLDVAVRLASSIKAGRNVEEILRTISTSEKQEKLPALPKSERIRSIEFDQVSFGYLDNTPQILDGFSRTLTAGRSYVITGPSGSGKSSLVDLLLKFYAPRQGSIRVNGRDIAAFSNESLRSHIVLAEQATRIFYGSVLENVRFNGQQDKKEAEKALELVGLTDLLATLPHGIDTVLAFQGNNFSGGQRQRIGIARALVIDADVLILDESTNALDMDTRKMILDTLLSKYRDRILIFISHDAYVMEQCDEIIDLNSSQPSAPEMAAAASMEA
jgi:ABC-type bacteriocin/lantibiotic exporter with double-glycine peptidase domain